MPDIVTILIALGLLFVAWKVLMGIVKFVAMGAIALLAVFLIFGEGFFA